MSLVQEFYLKSEEKMRKNGKNDIRHLKSHIIGGNSDLLYYLVFNTNYSEVHQKQNLNIKSELNCLLPITAGYTLKVNYSLSN